MPNPKQVAYMPTWHGGLRTDRAAHLLGQDELAECVNFDPLPGRLMKRKGSTVVANIDTNPVQRLLLFKLWDGTSQRLLTSGTNLKKWDGSTVYSALASAGVGSEIYQNRLLLLDGSDYYRYDGLAFSSVPLPGDTGATLTEVKRCKVIRQYLDRIYAAGDAQSPYTLYYSQTGRYDYFKTGDMIINLLAADGEAINGLEPYQGALVAFKESSLWAILGDPVSPASEVIRVAVPTGCVAPQSRAVAQGRIYYLGLDGVYSLVTLDKDNLSTIPVSQAIQPTIRKILNPEKAVGIFHQGRYYLSCQRDALPDCNNIVLVYDQRFETGDRLGPWTLYEGWNVGSWMIGEDGELYYGDAQTGQIRKALYGYNDNGAAYSAHVRTSLWNLGDVRVEKKIRSIHSLVSPDPEAPDQANLTITVETEQDLQPVQLTDIGVPNALIWDQTDWDTYFWDAANASYQIDNINLVSRFVQAVIDTSGVDQGVAVNALAYMFRPKRVK